MKRFLVGLLVIFLLIDVFLGINLFNPSLIITIKNKVVDTKLTISSSIPNKRAEFSNKSYLNKKLDELGFWENGAVRLYTKTKVDRITVESLHIDIVDKPQKWGQRSDSKSGEDILYSYGQEYDPKNQRMTLSIHMNPSFKSEKSLESRYSGMVLFSLFDLVQPYPTKDHFAYRKKASLFLSDFSNDILKNNFISIK